MTACLACGTANPDGFRFCGACAAPLAAAESSREVRKTVTVLFCDLVGSTTLGETHDPEVLRPLLAAYFEATRGAVERHGGRVEKFIGDAVSAVFGLPAAHEDDALRAVRAAMEMTERLAELSQGTAIPLAARIGVTTGEVLVPADGSPLIGDPMNTAARLQAAAEPGSVLIGEPTWQLVRDAVVAEPIAPLDLRGKSLPVAAWRVDRVASMSPMRTRRLDAPMVGRTRESALLESAFERAASDRACQLFTVMGSAGAGKSRLVEEFLAAHADDGAEVLRGRCLPYGDGITYYPVTEALRSALELPEFADADAIRAALVAAVGGDEHAASVEANLASLFALGPGGSAEETAWAIRRFLEHRAQARPLVLVLDDIHWGEPAFLDLVEHIADWSRDASILLLCMARPDLLDVRPSWGGGKTNATAISLAALTGPETDALIDGLLGSSAMPPDVRRRISAVAEGNPLFVEEMLRMLVDDGRLVRVDGDEGWAAAGDLADVHVPPTISALLSARLDRLSDAERAVVEAAAVAGKEFHRGAIGALLPESARAGLDVHLRSLVRKELVTPERSTLPGDDAYRFRHLLIRDAAYDAIPKADRATLHRAFADWLEGVAGERVAEQEEVVGYHLERAHRYREELALPEDRELRLRASKSLAAAGARAIDRGDLRAAVDLLRPAAELARGDRSELPILDDLGSALGDAGDGDAAAAAERRLADAALHLGDPVYGIRARHLTYLRRLLEYAEPWDPDEEIALTDEVIATYRAHGAARLAAGAIGIRASLDWPLGQVGRAMPMVLEALEQAKAAGDRRRIAWATSLVMSLLEWGPATLSAALAQADEFLAASAGDRWIEGIVLADRAICNAWIGRANAARQALAESRAIVDQVGWRDAAYFHPWIAADIAWLEGDLESTVVGCRESAAILEATGDHLTFTWLLGPRLGRALLDLGRDDEASAVAEMLELDSPFPETRASKLSIRGVLAARRGGTAEAVRLVDEAVGVAEATDLLILQGDVALDRAEVLRLAGRAADARAAARDALATHERKEYAIGIRRARKMLARSDGDDPSQGTT